MLQVSFDSSTVAALPTPPKPGHRVQRVEFSSCPGSQLRIEPVENLGPLDATGVPQDAWWRVACPKLPDRYVRLQRGAHSLLQMLVRYGFQDGTGCVNHRNVTLHYAPATGYAAPPPALDRCICRPLADACGVPQYYRNSGVCWYAALCTTTFANPVLAAMVRDRLPEDMRPHCDRCLFSREASEELRNQLWHRYRVGDDISQPPEMDGRNGFSEFTVLCAKLKIPLLRYEEHNGKFHLMSQYVYDRDNKRVKVTEPADPEAAPANSFLMALRFQDGDHHHKYPIRRRIRLTKHKRGRRYRLIGLYMGQKKCGHQIGVASPTGDWRDWVIGDADLHKDGIGPVHIRFGDGWDSEDKWWEAWSELVHVTKYGPGRREFCNLSPHNFPDDSLDVYRSAHSPRYGQASIDALYLAV